MKLECLRQIFEKKNSRISIFMKLRLVGVDLFHEDERTGRPDESIFNNLVHKFFILIHLLYSFTCFEHYCAHLQEDNWISAAYGIVTVFRWLFSTQVTRVHKFCILLHLLYPATCFEHNYAHLQEDNCISAASGIVTVFRWLFSTQVTRGLTF